MKLVEFHVGDPAAGAPCHGNAVTAGGIGVAGIEVHLAGTARGQCYFTGAERLDPVVLTIQHIGAQTAVVIRPELGTCYQVNGNVVFEQGDVRATACLTQQGGFHGVPGCIGCMQNPTGGMSAFAGQVEGLGHILVLLAGKWHPQIHQPLDRFRRMFNGETHRFRFVEANAGVQGICYM